MWSESVRTSFLGFASLFVAFLLDIFPLPSAILWLKPEWTLVVILYWAMTLPYSMGFTVIFGMGLLFDLSSGTILGEHAVALVLASYGMVKFRQYIQLCPLIQQAYIVGFLVFIYKLILFAIQGFLYQPANPLLHWISIISSAAVYPIINLILNRLQPKVILSGSRFLH